MTTYTEHEYDEIILFIRRLIVAAKRKTGFACNILETSHTRPVAPPRTVDGLWTLAYTAEKTQVDAWVADMKAAALRDGLTLEEITQEEHHNETAYTSKTP